MAGQIKKVNKRAMQVFWARTNLKMLQNSAWGSLDSVLAATLSEHCIKDDTEEICWNGRKVLHFSYISSAEEQGILKASKVNGRFQSMVQN